MYILIIVSFVSILSGYFYLFRPGFIIKMSKVSNRLISTDHNFIQYRKYSGVILLSIGVFLFFVGIKIM